MFFINANLPEERVQVLLPEKYLANYQMIAQSFSSVQILIAWIYLKRPSTTFWCKMYSVLNDFRCTEFLAYYTLKNKSNQRISTRWIRW